MSRTLIRFSIPFIGSAAVAFGMFACSSSDTPASPSGTGGAVAAGGGGGVTASGGASATSGGATNGGAATSGGATNGGAAGASGDPYTCQATPKRDPGGTDAVGAACCNTTAVGKIGKCVDAASVTDPALKSAYGHDSCVPTALCAKDDSKLGQADANGVFAKCTAAALDGLEGRCLPKCFVAGNPQAPQLKQDGCMSAELVCAPCYNPLDGSSTGACTQKAGDAPVNPAPAAYKNCGAGDAGNPTAGTCVPKVIVDASGNPSAGSLVQHECDTGDVCVPTLKAKDLSACFAKCTTTLQQFGEQYGPGACVPRYIVGDVNPTGLAILTKGTCTEEGDLCAPCADPLNGGVPTHSCE